MSPENKQSIERFLDVGQKAHPVFDVYNEALIASVVLGLLLQWWIDGLRPILRTLIPVVLWVLVLRFAAASFSGSLPHLPAPFSWHSLGVVSVAWAIGIMAWFTSVRYPRFGTRPLVHTGGLVLLLIVMTQAAFHPSPVTDQDRVKIARAVNQKVDHLLGTLAERLRANAKDPVGDPQLIAEASSVQIVADAALKQGPIWPLWLAGAAFLYLWWIAIITFDLTFVWHLYIRHSGAQKYVEKRLARARVARGAPARTAPELQQRSCPGT
jgi:hypothetical protein